MNNTIQQTLVDTLQYLISLIQEGIRPAEAEARFSLLQKQHPEIGMDLLWEEEPYDQSVHYDTLLQLNTEGTVSLSFCPERSLPWVMRGVHRWSERDLVRVNNYTLSVGEAITYLDFIWDEMPIVNRLVDMCIIQEALEKEPIELSDAQLQQAMDNFRRKRKLHKAKDTYRWLEQHGMSHEKLEKIVTNQGIVVQLRDRITAGRVANYFEEHQADFDIAYTASLYFRDEESAHQAWELICLGKQDFYKKAEQHFLAAVKRREHPTGDMFAVIKRGRAIPELAIAVFTAQPGEVLRPIRIEDGYSVVRVLSFLPARLDEETITTIKKILFDEWLAQQRHSARVEWYWGNAGQTPLQ